MISFSTRYAIKPGAIPRIASISLSARISLSECSTSVQAYFRFIGYWAFEAVSGSSVVVTLVIYSWGAKP